MGQAEPEPDHGARLTGLFEESADELLGTLYFMLGNREVILYWRAMEPRGENKVVLNPVAEIPGKFAGPASRAYLYYTDDLKWWVEPVKVEIGR